MANLNRYKFTFGKKSVTLTTEHDNLFMEEVEKVATEKYHAIKEKMPAADDETLASSMTRSKSWKNFVKKC